MCKLLPLLLLLSASRFLFAQCENRALNFDGDGDFITLSPLPAVFSPNSDFTVQMWFRSDATGGNVNCTGSFRRLFALSGTGSRFEIGECGGLLSIFFFPTSGGSGGPFNMSATNIRDGNWHQISVVRTGNNATVFLDCASIYTANNMGFLNSTLFRVGHWAGGPTPAQDWLGMVDEIKLWNTALPTADITACDPCLLEGSEPGLMAYWHLDQGVALQDNMGTTQAIDATPNGNNGQLSGFSLLPGAVSNFVCSNAELVYPDLTSCDLELRGQLPNTSPLLTEICSGDPVHFCLKKNNTPPQPPPGMAVAWEFNDDGAGWQPVADPSFIGFCFVSPSVNCDCSSANADGFVDRIYRAKITVNDPVNGSCEYISDEYTLRICCPISPATVDITVIPSGLLNNTLCAGDVADFTVTLNSPDPFVNTPGAATQILWYQNGAHNSAWDNLLTISATNVTVGTPSICFEAKVIHCSKTMMFTSCIKVDPMPKCGTIDKDPLCTTLGPPVTPCPNGMKCYSICPGDDASLAIATPFSDCNPQWEYSFDQLIWTNMGFSNHVQNTNELPGDWTWPSGLPPIYYRIACQPLTTPSGCEPCYGDTLRIEFLPPPPADVILGLSQICVEDGGALLSVATPGPYTYTWYCDGLEVQSGLSPSFFATKEACYWVDISDGCQVTQTNWHCLQICELIAAMSCPLSPNECAFLGTPITIDACIVTENTCGTNPATFIYSWTWIDVTGTYTGSGCSITYTPPPSGTTFTVTVTDPATGCTDTASGTIVPCQP